MGSTPEPRVAIVTGANHGIGAAVAKALAAQRTAVLCAYFRDEHQGGLDDPLLPAAYRATRMARADFVVESIRALGGRAAAMEADLSDTAVIPALFDAAEAELGPVEILVNNASGCIADTFVPAATDRDGRAQSPVTPRTIDRVFAVDTRAAALLIAEFARRHVARDGRWGRIIGMTSGDAGGFPEEVSYGAAKAAQVNFTLSAATELARHGVTANVVHPPTPTPAGSTRGRPRSPGPDVTGWPHPHRWPKWSPTWHPMRPASSPATSSASAEGRGPPHPQGARRSGRPSRRPASILFGLT